MAVDKDQKDSQLKKVTAFTEKPDKATASVFSMIKITSGIRGYLFGLPLLF